MTTRNTTTGFLSFIIALALILPACTDPRPQRNQSLTGRGGNGILTAVSDVRFQDKDTVAEQMIVRGSSLFLTGYPFGFSRWDIGADPESPRMTFAASDQLDTFSPYPGLGRWRVDRYASGALGVFGSIAFMSGTFGMSVVNITETNAPQEIQRYPMPQGDQDYIDHAFVVKGIAGHPTLPVLYSFREQDFIYTLNASSLPSLEISSKMAYSAQGGVCCATGATVFQNKLYLGMTSALWSFDLQSNGSLGAVKKTSNYHVKNIASTKRFLYVQHVPTSSASGTSRRATGIYVFDRGGLLVTQLPISPLRFSVSSDDSHLYVNEDNTSVRIYRINWQNLQ